MLCKSPCNDVAREVVDNCKPVFPTACLAGRTPRRQGEQEAALPVLPTGISKKDWACLSTREISWLLIHKSISGTNWPSGPSSSCWQVSVGGFIPTFVSCVKLYSCLCHGKRAGVNKMYPSSLQNHSHITQEHKVTPPESVFFVNLVLFTALCSSLVEHQLS